MVEVIIVKKMHILYNGCYGFKTQLLTFLLSYVSIPLRIRSPDHCPSSYTHVTVAWLIICENMHNWINSPLLL